MDVESVEAQRTERPITEFLKPPSCIFHFCILIANEVIVPTFCGRHLIKERTFRTCLPVEMQFFWDIDENMFLALRTLDVV